jgi:subtilisin-like proprotein convertase family protein
MNPREGRRLVRNLLLAGAALSALALFTWAALDFTPSSPGRPASSLTPGKTTGVSPAPILAAGGPTVAAPDDRAATSPALPPGNQAGEPSELLIFLQPGTDPVAYAGEHGLLHLHTLRSDPDAHVFSAPDTATARAHLGRARGSLRVRRAYPNERLQRIKCIWVPNDPYYPNGSPSGFPGQWHLGNGAVPGVDIHVPAAWNRDITGAGVLLGIVDDGLEITHPDLAPNYVAGDSWDFGQNDGNPSPVNGGSNEDRHGTSVAGVAAARGGNGIGGTGAAPLAGLAGCRIDFVTQTTQMFVDATLFHSNAANSNIKIKNHSYGYSATYIESQAERDAVATSAGVGTIHLYAAGNERGGAGEDSNKQDLQSSPDVIAVAALGSDGKFSYYSSFGANVFVTAPSSGVTGFGITTTDRAGSNGYNRRSTGPSDGDSFPDLNYTSTFGGTSSATPLASGVLALVKQVQPNLDLRFAKHLLARTSQIVDPNDSTATGGGDGVKAGSAWQTNKAGLTFNQNYGFGLIDADALTQQALLYSGVTALQTATTPVISVATAIPDNNLTGISRTFSFASAPTTPLEEMLVTLDITHPFRGDVEVFLTSPLGTQSRLAYRTGADNGANINWTFVSNAFWGENPAGTWTLQVRDVGPADLGTWTSFSATALMGQLIVNTTPPAVSSIVRAGSDPTNAGSVTYTVTFTKSVTGVDAADFTLASTGSVSGASVTGVSGSGSLFTVTVNSGTGDGTLRLDLVDNDSIQDGVGNKLGGTGAGNGNFNAGQFYTLDRTSPAVLRVRSSTPDGLYGLGATINVTVDFTEPVTLAGGNLQVTLSTGDLVTIPPFGPATSASGTYTVGAGDNSADLDSNSPLTLTAGSLRDASGNACGLTVPAGQHLADLQALLIDTTAPQIVRVRSTTADGFYRLGAAIDVTVDFTEPVTLAGGNLQVTLSTGAVVTIPPFGPATSASGTYTVGAGDNSADLNESSPLTLSGGTLRDATGNACVLTVPAGQHLADLKALVIDTTAPSVTINQAATQADPSNASSILFTVVFSETVTGFATGDVTLTGTAGATTATVSGAGPTYTVTVTGMTTSGTVIASIGAGAAMDLAGNASVASTSTDNVVTYDIAPPTVSINQAAAQVDPTNASPILFTVVFSKPVTGFTTGDVTLGGTAGPTTAIVSGPGPTYSVSVSGMTGDGTVTASIGAGVAADAAGNGNLASTSTDNTVTYDATSPTVTINQAAGQSDPANVGPVLFTVVFSEAVTGFDATDVSLAGSTVGGTLLKSVSGTGTTYTVSVTGMTGTGSVVATVPAGAAVDAVSHPNSASTSTDNVVTFNTIVPTVTINQAGGQADPTNVASIVFNVVFSEAMNGFATGDVSFAGSTAGGSLLGTVSGATPGSVFTVTVTGMTSSGTIVAAIPAGVATSAATGTANAASTSTDNTVTYDIIPPTVTINQAGGQTDPTNGAPILFTVTFSESVTGFATGDVTLGGTAGATTATVSGSGTTYTVSVTGMTQTGTVIASVAPGVAADVAGNANVASTSTDNTVLYDITPPTVTINQAGGQADPTNGSSILYSVLFSKPVTGFATGDVSFAGSTVGGSLVGTVSGSGTSYTVTVTGMTGNGSVVATVLTGMAVDSAGNPNAASTSTDNTVTRDVTPPTVTINQAAAQADPTNSSPILFTVVFSEAVTGFVTGDVTLTGTAGATTATVSGTGPTYAVTVTGMTTSGTVIASIGAGAAADLAGNASAASTSTDNVVAYDIAPPTVTINQAAAQADPTNSSPILFTVVFSKPVTGFATGDVTLGGTAGATTAIVSGPGPTYTVTVSGMTGDGTITATLAAGVAADAAGNGNLASTSTDNTVAYDGVAPTVTINAAAGQADPARTMPILFTVEFSEPVTGFTAADVVVGGTAGGIASVSGGPSTYTVSISTLSGDGKVVVSIPANAAMDSAGNGSLASTGTSNSVTFDATAPIVNQVTSTTANGTYGLGASIAITVVFSEPVTVTGTPQLTLETGAADAVVNFTSGSGTNTLVFAFTVAAGHVSNDLDYVSVAALTLNGGTIRDSAGNDANLALAPPGSPGSLGANKNLIVDTTPPLAGTVNDGWAPPDVDTQLSVTTLSANWSGFSDPQSGIAGYEWAIGTTSGGQELLAFTPVGLQTGASTSAVDLLLALANGATCYVTVRATNGAGLTATATSDGVTITGTATTGPAAPAGFFATASDQAVLLDWLPSPSSGISFYRVWWKPAASAWTQAVRVEPLSGAVAAISGLTNGTAYDFMIKAVDTAENESPGIFASATPLAPITIGGVGSYGTAQAAIDAAVPGETVVLGPGTYAETLVLHPGVSLSGSSPALTVITGSPGSVVLTVQGSFPADPTSTISDLTLTGGTVGVDAGTADVFIHHLIIHHVTSHGVASAAGGRLRAVNCTILSNGGDGVRAVSTAEVRNCIVGRNGGAGLNVPAGAVVNYDDVYANGTSDYPAGAGGTGNLTAPAIFVDEPSNNFIESSGSPTVDSGDPLDAFPKELAPNGARINQGAFGNTRWAASTPAPGGGSRGGCGLLGPEGLGFALLSALLNRRRRERR